MRKVEGLHENEVAKQMGSAIETVENQVAKGCSFLPGLGASAVVLLPFTRVDDFRMPRDAG